MERFSIEGSKLISFYSAETLLEKVFRDIETDLKAKEQVVCQYILNGKPLSEQDELRYSKIRLSNVLTLEYLAESENNLIFDVIEGWIDGTPDLIEMATKCGKFIHTNHQWAISEHQIESKVRELVSNVDFYIDSLQSIHSLLGRNIPDLKMSWNSRLSDVSFCCKEILERLLLNEQRKKVMELIEKDLTTGLKALLRDLYRLESFLVGEKLPFVSEQEMQLMSCSSRKKEQTGETESNHDSNGNPYENKGPLGRKRFTN